jgi:hypothetical protein
LKLSWCFPSFQFIPSAIQGSVGSSLTDKDLRRQKENDILQRKRCGQSKWF